MQLYAPSLLLLHSVEAELRLPQWRRLAALLVSEMRYTEALQAAEALPPAGASGQRRPTDLIQLARSSLLAFYADADKGGFRFLGGRSSHCPISLWVVAEDVHTELQWALVVAFILCDGLCYLTVGRLLRK